MAHRLSAPESQARHKQACLLKVPQILPDLGHHVPVLSCYGLNCILPLNSCVEALTPNVTVFENWAYKEVILVN